MRWYVRTLFGFMILIGCLTAVACAHPLNQITQVGCKYLAEDVLLAESSEPGSGLSGL